MAYFQSLMRQSGLGSGVPSRRRSLAIDIEETRAAEAPAQFDSPKQEPARTVTTNTLEVRQSPLPAAATVPSQPIEDPRLREFQTLSRSEALPAPPKLISPSDDDSPVVRIGKSKGLDSAEMLRPVTFEDVRAWVAEPFRASEPQRTAIPRSIENTDAASPAPRPVQVADNITVEIGAIQILIEEPRTGLVSPQPAPKQTQAPAESWTLPGRHYLRP
jgi:hypothetical protein